MGRPSNRAKRRAELVEAALSVVAEHGYERASIAAIAEKAGLASGLVHYHFENKLAILLALGERLAQTLSTRFEELGGDLDAFVRAHLELGPGADHAAVAAWVALGAEATSLPEVGALYERLVEERHQTLTALMKREGIGAPEQRATTLLALIEGYYQLASATSLVATGSATSAAFDVLAPWRLEASS